MHERKYTKPLKLTAKNIDVLRDALGAKLVDSFVMDATEAIAKHEALSRHAAMIRGNKVRANLKDKLPNGLPQFLTPQEVSAAIGVSRNQLNSWIASGKFPTPIRFGTKTRRFKSEQLKEFFAASA